MARSTNILQLTTDKDLAELNRILKEIQLRINDLGGAGGAIQLDSDVTVMGKLQLAEQEQQRPILTDEAQGQVVFQPKEGQAPEAQFQVAEETIIDRAIDQRVHRMLDVVQRAAQDGVDVGKASTFNFRSMTVALDLDADKVDVTPLSPTVYFPDTMVKDAGGAISGTVADVREIGGGEVNLTEANGTAPGYTLRFIWAGLPSPNVVYAHLYYTGTHAVALQGWNYSSSTWVTLTTLALSGSSFVAVSAPLTADYMSGGAAEMRFYHADTGNPSHHLHVDYLAIGVNAVNPSQIDHGSLSGLTDKDHPASAIINTPAGGIAATDVQAAINELDSEKIGNASSLTELAQEPDQDVDFLFIYDDSAAANKKILPKYISGNQPWCVGFSSGQLFTTGGANLTSFDYTFLADELQVGDTIHIFGTAGGTLTAGIKSLTIAIGTGTPTTIFSMPVTGSNIFEFMLELLVRTTTSVALKGLSWWGAAGSPMVNNRIVSDAQTVANISSNSQLVRLVGTHTGSSTELTMQDYIMRVYRAGGNFSLV